MGVRNTSVDQNNHALCQAVRECLEEVLEKTGCGWQDIGCIVAAGMLSSNLGLYEVPHLVAPVSLDDFSAGLHPVSLPDIAPLPFYILPGVKNLSCPVAEEGLAQMDIMRGEEAEALALLPRMPVGKVSVLVLPGSHTKFVFVDAQARISSCMTTLSGELLALLTTGSILADTVGHAFVSRESLCPAYIQKGYRAAQKSGLAHAAFACRIRGLFSAADKNQMANFLLGAVLQQDILALCTRLQNTKRSTVRIWVAGNEPVRAALYKLLKAEAGFLQVEELRWEDDLSARGCLEVALRKGLLAWAQEGLE